MSLTTTTHSYLAGLGTRIAADGITPHAGDVLVVADAAARVAPAAARVLADVAQPEVARGRALAVASSAILRSRAASESLGTALTDVAGTDLALIAA